MYLFNKAFRTFSTVFAVVVTAVGLFSVTNVSEAANPAAGTLNPTGSNVTWDGAGIGPAVPSLPPPVEVRESRRGFNLSWLTPDSNGSEITSYRIYRGIGNDAPTFVGEVKASATTFSDRRNRTFQRGEVYYQVTAVNKYGESPRTRKFYANETSVFSRIDPEFAKTE